MIKFLKKLLWFVVLIALIIVAIFFWQVGPGGLSVKVINQTKVGLNGLSLGDHILEKGIILPELGPGQTYQTKVVPPRRAGANTMWLAYNDNQGRTYRVVLLGYFESGYHGRATARIKDVNPDGTLRVEVQSELQNY